MTLPRENTIKKHSITSVTAFSLRKVTLLRFFLGKADVFECLYLENYRNLCITAFFLTNIGLLRFKIANREIL